MNEEQLKDYPSSQVQQELLDFFQHWRPADILGLGPDEIRAWKKHFIALRAIGWIK